ncbi:MAG: thiamine pyrophosphate-binding protein [Ruthenibacterium sp.]
MKISDYIVQFLEQKNITDVFGYPGGMVTHLMDSLHQSQKIHTHINLHEQASAFCATAYGQLKKQPTMAFATSGPGATNLITGICDAWFDSAPAIFITGQVNTYEGKGTLSVRQKGFQETDIVAIVSSVTKFAKQICTAEEIPAALETAYTIACSGRPGPVLLDIPMNVFRGEIAVNSAMAEEKAVEARSVPQDGLHHLLALLQAAKRPLIIAGCGIHQADAEIAFRAFVEKSGIPVVTSMPAVDLLPAEHPCRFGFIGAYGQRSANILVEKSDCILTLGARLDNRQTGNDVTHFATHAKLIRVDVDAGELENCVKKDALNLCCDLKNLLQALQKEPFDAKKQDAWRTVCSEIREKANCGDTSAQLAFVAALSRWIASDAVITTDVGQNQVWVAQAFAVKDGQRILFSAGHGAMGYSLPAAIGACCVTHKPVYCFTGDGGLQMNLQELELIRREQLPVKIIVFNNHSLGMIRHFQELYFDSHFSMTTANSGYSCPDFTAIAQAYQIAALRCESVENNDALRVLLQNDKPCLVELFTGDITYVTPKSVYNKPLSQQEPPMDAALFNELMSL